MIRFRPYPRTIAPILALLTLLLALPASQASAGITWCRVDPAVSLNGAEVQIIISVPEPYQALVAGPVRVTIATPEDVDREILWTDAGFNGYGEDVRFDTIRGSVKPDRSFLITVEVSVPVEDSLAVQMQVEAITGADSRVLKGRTSGATMVTRVQGAY